MCPSFSFFRGVSTRYISRITTPSSPCPSFSFFRGVSTFTLRVLRKRNQCVRVFPFSEVFQQTMTYELDYTSPVSEFFLFQRCFNYYYNYCAPVIDILCPSFSFFRGVSTIQG